MEERVPREAKLNAAKDIVASYVRSEKGAALSPDEVCEMLRKVYGTVDDLVPDPDGRRIGLA